MKCPNCGGEIRFSDGMACCSACNSKHKIESVFDSAEVYICNIEYDSNGRRTRDSILAQELYQKLESKNIRTFYERASASGLADDALEQIHYSAIYNAKVVLVVGTSAENFRTILEKQGEYFEGKVVVPFYADISPADIPPELNKFQAMDYASIGWESDLEKGILRALGREAELEQRKKKSSAKKRTVIIAVVVLVLCMIGAGIFAFFHFGKSTETEMPTELSTQQIYSNAQELLNQEKYVDAIEQFSKIRDYKDSEQQIKIILNRYEGYYQTPDKQFSMYFNIEKSGAIYMEITDVSDYGTAVATIDGLWNGISNSYSLVDSFGNSADITITLKNDGLDILVDAAETGEYAHVRSRNITFALADKTEKPEIIKITRELLLSWLQTPTTKEQIVEMGFELLPGLSDESPDSIITAGGGVVDGAGVYHLADNKNIVVMFVSRDTSRQDVLWKDGLSNYDDLPTIVCAVQAPAEYLIPDEIGTPNRAFVEDGVLYAAGGNSMYIDWGYLDLYINFGSSAFEDFAPTGVIQSDTLVGAICEKTTGKSFFVKTAVQHVSGTSVSRMAAEYDDYYVVLNQYDMAFKADKNDYELLEHIESYRAYVDSEKYNVYSQPSFESAVVKVLPAGFCLFFETVLQDGILWAKLPDNSGWVCMDYLDFDVVYNSSAYDQPVAMQVSAARGLNLREQPHTDSEIIVVMPLNASVTVYSIKGDWAYVEFKGQRGYCSVGHLANPS